MKNLVTKVFLIVFITMTFISCGDSPMIKYNCHVLKTEPMKPYKNNIYLSIQDKLTEQQLTEVAQHIREMYSEYTNLFIFYNLPENEIGSGAWATSHFTPALEIQILGATKSEDKMLDNVSIDAGEQIGKWKEEDAMMSAIYILFKENDELKIKMKFMDGSGMIIKVKESDFNGNMRYNYKNEDKNDFFIIEKNGNLGLYDIDGKISEAKKIE